MGETVLKTVEIQLTEKELKYCEKKGNERHYKAEAKGRNRKEAYDGSFDQRLRHIQGVQGELCFARALGKDKWEATVDTFKQPDVDGYHVRATAHRAGHLILRPDDKSNASEPFAVVIVHANSGTVLAHSILGKDAMIAQFWKESDGRGRGAWWVPQSAIRAEIESIVLRFGLSLQDGMARVRGSTSFRTDSKAGICWHCKVTRVCNCVSCDKKCGACFGIGAIDLVKYEQRTRTMG